MKISKKTQPTKEVSTSSMPDIIFMLLIFFMVTTVMREYDGLDVLMPRAEKIEKLEQLRAIENGMRIDVQLVDTVPLGVDTLDDLKRARELLAPDAN